MLKFLTLRVVQYDGDCFPHAIQNAPSPQYVPSNAAGTTSSKSDCGDMYAGASVFFPQVHDLLVGFEAFAATKGIRRGFGGNVGLLAEPHELLFWPLSLSMSPSEVTEQVLADLVRTAKPFLEKCSDLGETCRLWESRQLPVVYLDHRYDLAAAYWLMGEHEQARNTMERLAEECRVRFQKKGNPLDASEAETAIAFRKYLLSKPDVTL